MGAVVPTVQAFEALLHPDDRNGTLEAIERVLNEGADIGDTIAGLLARPFQAEDPMATGT